MLASVPLQGCYSHWFFFAALCLIRGQDGVGWVRVPGAVVGQPLVDLFQCCRQYVNQGTAGELATLIVTPAKKLEGQRPALGRYIVTRNCPPSPHRLSFVVSTLPTCSAPQPLSKAIKR